MFQLPCAEVDDLSGSVSSLDFCPSSMSLAVGNECSQVKTFCILLFFFPLFLEPWSEICYTYIYTFFYTTVGSCL